ncbi:Oidioi.mRNA.OKI2018_I69.chr1.g737.t1.cds [Oikopleura dioica]|uniref:Oidioi.mRNA.OKI2018_I69.chr1.g737.t1.cds n=1 Tax=Oikopleura dioica TaxID=34765 RepID=A0ABN7SKR8_OIKDI|nr:Oidioi.mRNA.OKI2018_I69.chr1.g737.t1.cds [Oikopleura dioica]
MKMKKKSSRPCKTCGKLFQTSWHVRRHERIHTGEKPFECELCDFKCNLKENMVVHRRKLHKKALELLHKEQLKIRARKVINQVVHYRMDERKEEKENWVPIFDVEDFEDVVEFEKFMSGITKNADGDDRLREIQEEKIMVILVVVGWPRIKFKEKKKSFDEEANKSQYLYSSQESLQESSDDEVFERISPLPRKIESAGMRKDSLRRSPKDIKEFKTLLLSQITSSSGLKPRLSAAERLKIQPGKSLKELYKPQSSSIQISARSSNSRKSSTKQKLTSISEENNDVKKAQNDDGLLRAPTVSLDSDL